MVTALGLLLVGGGTLLVWAAVGGYDLRETLASVLRGGSAQPMPDYGGVMADVGNVLSGTTGGSDIVSVGRAIQAMGYRVSEHPAFGGVTRGSHVPNSYHYRGRAIDISWPNENEEPAKLDQLHSWIKQNVPNYVELIWRAPGHWRHLHLAI